MKRTLVSTTLFAAFLAGILATSAFAQDIKWLSSYWDGCKPTCSWFQNIPRGSEHGLSKACDASDIELFLGDIAEARCYKDGGPAHTCWDQIPFVDPDNPLLAYGFGATSEAACGECFEVTFTGGYPHGVPMPMHTALASSGKKVILMGRNTGADVAANQIDFMIPGGGLGMFNCFTHQPGINAALIGRTHGGLLADCIDEMIRQFGGNWNAPGLLEAAQACHRAGCNSAFGAPNHALLLQGCLFHSDWMMSAPNPEATVRKLDNCPQALIDKYKPKSSKWTVMIKGVDFTSSTGNVQVNQGNFTLSGVNTGSTITFNNVMASYTGEYDLSFSVATGEQTTISVTVNDQPAGSTSFNTNNWGTFTLVSHNSKVNLNEGANTIVLSFQTNSVNFDYFILVGEEQLTSVKHNTARATKTHANVTLKAIPQGFTAALPAEHGYTSYKLFDLQGREIKSGSIENGATNLKFNNLKHSVIFLKLDGKNSSTVLRAVTL
ncbi:MAG: carbohydrate-binding protein [Fibromonadaceae bacterium]|jgi:hypothetical protein|nr:carbohydrate-binding protein [Fibromonadaceae bacterium]